MISNEGESFLYVCVPIMIADDIPVFIAVQMVIDRNNDDDGT